MRLVLTIAGIVLIGFVLSVLRLKREIDELKPKTIKKG